MSGIQLRPFNESDCLAVRHAVEKAIGPKWPCRTQLFDGGLCMGLQIESPKGYQMDYYFGTRSYTNKGVTIANPALSLDSTTLTLICNLCLRAL
jgi:hypothetical protein